MATDSDSKKDPNHDLVVVGASAGGVTALSTLVSTLDKAFPAPIVIAQHLDPQRPSHLGTILERRTTLPIVVVSEHEPTPLENGKIYVVPANRHVKIVDGHVNLEADSHERPKPSVDMLLSSAAQSYGEDLVAVILTGSGSDGAAGAVDVKNAGGVVIIQNPATAPYPSMPLSLPPTAVDHVVEIEQVGPLLFDLLRNVNLPSPEKLKDPLRDLLGEVSSQTSIDFQDYKPSTILRRIGSRMAVTRNGSIREYTDYVRTHPEEVNELVKAFLIRVTGFFRDPEAFRFIKKNIIPELIDRAKNERTLRIWSAGCATGEEAYSLALLIADHLGLDFPAWNVKIFATDLAADAIEFARRGLYPANVLDDLPVDYKVRFFERVEHGYRVSKSLRQAVIFGHQDISRGVPFPRIDLVTCRNLLIYLQPELQQAVLDLFAYSLHQSRGYLFLGKAETTRPTEARFEVVDKKWKIYRCVGAPSALPVHGTSIAGVRGPNVWREPRRPSLTPAVSNTLEATRGEIDLAQLRRLNETLLRYTTAAVAIVDRGYRILTINAPARRLFGVHDLAYDQDFLHTVRGIHYQEMRHAIDTAFRERLTMALTELELDATAEGVARHVNLTVMIMQLEQVAADLAVITAVDVTEPVQMRKQLEAVQREQAGLVAELSESNRRFITINKELQDANEELQAANEELMLTQEELQATNEEFESTNEELQATNEELETNNEELQATNEELQTTNDELTARTLELQGSTAQHKSEQLQWSALLERFPHYVMVIDAQNLTIETINPGYKELLGGREVVGLPISEIFSGRDLEHLLNRLRAAARDGESVTTTPIRANVAEHIAATESRFVHTIVPIGDVSSSDVSRLFIYSEKVDGRT